jgi:hypothetical protein
MITRHNSSRPTILSTIVPAVGTSSRGAFLALLTMGFVTRHSRQIRNSEVAAASVRNGVMKPKRTSHVPAVVQYFSNSVGLPR